MADELVTPEVAVEPAKVKKEKVTKVIGGDGLVDGETTYGEDVKGNSDFDKK
jgi:hypothetical protein